METYPSWIETVEDVSKFIHFSDLSFLDRKILKICKGTSPWVTLLRQMNVEEV
jgi:hypothetical protein